MKSRVDGPSPQFTLDFSMGYFVEANASLHLPLVRVGDSVLLGVAGRSTFA